MAASHHAHRVLWQRAVERLGRRRPPIDHERVTCFVGDRQPSHVQAAAVDEVEAADEQPVLGDGERGQPEAGVSDGAVALEQCLRVPRLGQPPRGPGEDLRRVPHGDDPVVRRIQIGPLPVQFIVTEHERIIAAHAR